MFGVGQNMKLIMFALRRESERSTKYVPLLLTLTLFFFLSSFSFSVSPFSPSLLRHWGQSHDAACVRMHQSPAACNQRL